jgi:hypothetical protein
MLLLWRVAAQAAQIAKQKVVVDHGNATVTLTGSIDGMEKISRALN